MQVLFVMTKSPGPGLMQMFGEYTNILLKKCVLLLTVENLKYHYLGRTVLEFELSILSSLGRGYAT
jgi:hypothetical protein